MLSGFSCVWLFATLWTVAHQAPLSMGFSRQEYWNALPFPPPGDLPKPGIQPTSLVSPALAGGFFTTSTTREVSQDPFKQALAKLNACRRAGGPLPCQLLGLGSSRVAGKGQDSWGWQSWLSQFSAPYRLTVSLSCVCEHFDWDRLPKKSSSLW